MDFVDRVRALADVHWGSSTGFCGGGAADCQCYRPGAAWTSPCYRDLLVIFDMDFNESLSLSSWSFYENLEPTGDVRRRRRHGESTAWGLQSILRKISELFGCVGMEFCTGTSWQHPAHYDFGTPAVNHRTNLPRQKRTGVIAPVGDTRRRCFQSLCFRGARDGDEWCPATTARPSSIRPRPARWTR